MHLITDHPVRSQSNDWRNGRNIGKENGAKWFDSLNSPPAEPHYLCAT